MHIDEILVTGSMDAKHLQTLKQVLASLHKFGLCLKIDKVNALSSAFCGVLGAYH